MEIDISAQVRRHRGRSACPPIDYDKAETAVREQHRAERQAAETEPAERPVDDRLDADLSGVE